MSDNIGAQYQDPLEIHDTLTLALIQCQSCVSLLSRNRLETTGEEAATLITVLEERLEILRSTVDLQFESWRAQQRDN